MKTIMKNEHAQAGVGTLIIFIAMVLVAAVAAAVLIQTSGVMQSKSTTTTKEAAEAVTESIVIDSVSGTADTSAILDIVNITVRIGPGSGDINASKVIVMVKGQQIAQTVYGLRNFGTDAVLKSGSLAVLSVDVTSLNLVTKDIMTISITPEKGATINMPITLPTISASATGIGLYP